jgi:hypothetical protein
MAWRPRAPLAPATAIMEKLLSGKVDTPHMKQVLSICKYTQKG